ncbi:VOC family protein [Nonomuraea sp. LPB2021202275-12-8]|uniref:VOC family protein n=1 Tax=Nonomuraea sp. LPB2021202275-12-8 TaxID=3120159 RepID=UPI00300C24A1
MNGASVRYLVDDVDMAVTFYTELLGFAKEAQMGDGFAIVSRDGLRLLLTGTGGPGGAAQPTPDGRFPEPGGWNRIQLEVADAAAETERLRAAGATFRGDLIKGRGGTQIVLEDPAGNPIELFEPAG